MIIVYRLFAIYGASVASFCYTLVVLPFVVKLMSLEDWSIVAKYIAVCGFLSILDMGASQIVPSLYVQKYERGHPDIELKTYMSMGFVISGVFVLITFAGYLFGFVGFYGYFLSILLLLWFFGVIINIYLISAVMALKLNKIYGKTVVFSVTVKSVLIFSFAYFSSIDAENFVFSQTVAVLLEFFIYFRCVNKKIDGGIFDLLLGCRAIVSTKYFVKAVIVLMGGVVAQLDRFLVWISFSAVDFSFYVLISTFALMWLSIQYPLLKYFVARYDPSSNGKLLRGAFVCYVIFGCAFAYCSDSLFYLWSGGVPVYYYSDVIRLVVFGVVLNSFYNIWFQLRLIKKAYNLILYTNMISGGVALVSGYIFWGDLRMGGIIWISMATSQIISLFIDTNKNLSRV